MAHMGLWARTSRDSFGCCIIGVVSWIGLAKTDGIHSSHVNQKRRHERTYFDWIFFMNFSEFTEIRWKFRGCCGEIQGQGNSKKGILKRVLKKLKWKKLKKGDFKNGSWILLLQSRPAPSFFFLSPFFLFPFAFFPFFFSTSFIMDGVHKTRAVLCVCLPPELAADIFMLPETYILLVELHTERRTCIASQTRRNRH